MGRLRFQRPRAGPIALGKRQCGEKNTHREQYANGKFHLHKKDFRHSIKVRVDFRGSIPKSLKAVYADRRRASRAFWFGQLFHIRECWVKIGFIGAGQMAKALASGMVSAEHQFYYSDPDDNAADAFEGALKDSVCQRLSGNDEVGAQVDVLFLAVKPQYFSQACSGLQLTSQQNPLTISVATGVSLEQIQSLTGISRLIRIMPNTPALIGKGVLSMTPANSLQEDDIALAKQLLTGAGLVERVPEELIDAVVGVSGSGPAYVFTFIEALSDGGVLMGLPRKLATEFAVQTVLGAAELMQQSGDHPGVLRDQVASPGGTTIAAISSLEQNGFRNAIIQAVRAAADKSRSLGS